MGKRSREKGARGELETKVAFEAQGFRARRSLTQSRNKRGDENHKTESDVLLEEVPELWVENKLMKVPSPMAALRQAEDDCRAAGGTAEGGAPLIPVAVCRADKERATITMRLSDFMPFFVSVYGSRRTAKDLTFQPPPEVDTDD